MPTSIAPSDPFALTGNLALPLPRPALHLTERIAGRLLALDHCRTIYDGIPAQLTGRDFLDRLVQALGVSLEADLDPGPGGIPVLLRHYLSLGGQVLAFNVDRQFSDVLDGLIVVDLARTERKALERYLGREGAAEFLGRHAAPAPGALAACA